MTLYKYRDSYSPGDGVVVDCCNLHRRRHVVLAHPLRPSPVGPVHLPLSVEGGPPVSQVTYSTLAAITKGNSRTAQSKRARGTTMDLPRALACVVFNVARHGPVPFSDLLPSTNRYLSAREGTSKAGGRQTGVSGRTGSVRRQVDDVVVSSPPTSKRRTKSSRSTPGHISSYRLRSTAPPPPMARGASCQPVSALQRPTINAGSTYINCFQVSPLQSRGSFTTDSGLDRLDIQTNCDLHS